jgi:hypothetical protein
MKTHELETHEPIFKGICLSNSINHSSCPKQCVHFSSTSYFYERTPFYVTCRIQKTNNYVVDIQFEFCPLYGG